MTKQLQKITPPLLIGLLGLLIIFYPAFFIKADSGEKALEVKNLVRNLTRGDTRWYSLITAQPSDELLFRIEIKSIGEEKAENIMVRNVLPQKVIYLGELQVDYSSKAGNISTEAINIGDLSPGSWRVVSFKAKIASPDDFQIRRTDLINTALVYTQEVSQTATSKIAVIKTGAPEAPTEVVTGIGSGIILNSILLPLGIAILGVWIFRSKLIGLDKCLEKRKKETEEYRARKKLEQLRKERLRKDKQGEV